MTARPHRAVGIPIIGYAILSVAGCGGALVSLAPEASSGSLACSLNQLERLGYLVTPGASGSPWYQAFRGSGGGGEEIWIRLADDGRRAPWLDLRVTNWGQSWHSPTADGPAGPIQAPRSAWQGQDDARTVLDRCESRVP